MGGGGVTVPVVTVDNACPNGIQVSRTGVPVGFNITINPLANIKVFQNGVQLGSTYLNVSTMTLEIAPATSGYNSLRFLCYNASASSELNCSFYGTTAVGSNTSYGYTDRNEDARFLFDDIDMDLFWSLGEAAMQTQAQEWLQGVLKLSPTASAIMTGIFAGCMQFLGEEASTNEEGNCPVCIPNQTLQACVNYSDNQTPCPGYIYINNECINFQFNPGAFIVAM
jgi:hypothetical protein